MKMWYEQVRPKRILPTRFVDYFCSWNSDITLMNILAREYDIRIVEDPLVVFCHQFGTEYRQYNCKKIFSTGESWHFNSDAYDLLLTFDYEETEKSFRFPIYGYYFQGTSLCKNITEIDAKDILKKKTKFCNFVYSNRLSQERIRFMELLSQYQPVDCCGGVENNTGTSVPGAHSGPEKIRFLSDYKFTIAFENTVKVGYTTEKICCPMAAYSLPVYFGNPEIHRDFNPKSFVNVHECGSFEAAIEHIKELDQNEDLYLQTMREPWFHGNIPTQYVDTHSLTSRLVHWIEKHNLSMEPGGGIQ
jgi:hypothetical protein